MMPTDTTRPTFCTEAHLRYLDTLRASGITNMFGAAPFLYRAFKHSREDEGLLSRDQARVVLLYWMRTFAERRKEGAR